MPQSNSIEHDCKNSPVAIPLILSTAFLLLFGFVIVSLSLRHRRSSPQRPGRNERDPRTQPRFRKRDRLAFVSNKVLRNARGVVSYIKSGEDAKRRTLATIARRIVLLGSDPPKPSLKRPGLPDAFLEEEDELPERQSLPSELCYVVKSMRVLGNFSQVIMPSILKDMETVIIPEGSYLFTPEDQNDSMYILQSGRINVLHIDLENGEETLLKTVESGEPIVSFLCLLEFLNPQRKKDSTYKFITATAIKDSKATKIPFECLKRGFESHPEHLLPVVQILMLRLQRVTLAALNQYFGLGPELMRTTNRGKQGNKEFDREETELQVLARDKFCELLGVETNDELLSPSSVQIKDYQEGSILVDSSNIVHLALVLRGCFSISQRIDGSDAQLQRAYPGAFLNQLSVLTGEPSLIFVEAQVKSKAALLSHSLVIEIIKKHCSGSSVSLALSVVQFLSPFIRAIDFSLEWIFVDSGKALYKQSNTANGVFVVLSGRLRSVIVRDDKKELLAEFGRGEITGILETLLHSKRTSTLMAVRDTEVAKLPSELIDFIKTKYPKVLIRLISLFGQKLINFTSQCGGDLSLSEDASSFSTVALIAITKSVPLSAFALELTHASSSIGPSLRLTSKTVRDEVGDFALDKYRDFRLTNWLTKKEDQHKLVIFQCDKDLTPWSKLCLRHADIILLLANPLQSLSSVSKFEEKIDRLSQRTRKDLIFIYPESVQHPEKTNVWLNDRACVYSHMHMRCPPRLFFKKSEHRAEDYYNKKVLLKTPNIHSDFSRLARALHGCSVGLVLGGGGARGCAHVGMIRAIIEAGIPIDRLGGVSIGALVGALYSQEGDLTHLTIKARVFSQRMSSKWRQVLDLTYPTTSLFTGKAFNAFLEDIFGNRDIEDLWLPFFTVTTDITLSSIRIHDYGSLWRYVRSSMSLAGYLPPLCDPQDGHLLLDGGYTNNLPADIMRSKGAERIIAIDVGTLDEEGEGMTNYGDSLSGWRVLWRKWNPLLSPLNVLDQSEIQSRLAYVSCVKQMEGVKKSSYCDYIRPPIDEFGTLEFDAFEKIMGVGYEHGKTYFTPPGTIEEPNVVPSCSKGGPCTSSIEIEEANQSSI